MKKSDLKYGNVVEERGGYKCVVYCNKTEKALISLNTGACVNLDNYREDLTDIEGFMEFDIMKVYKDYTCTELLWERKDELKLTEDEKVILRNLPKEYKWIVRDHIGSLWIFENKPSNDIFGWFYSTASTLPFPNLFKFIKYEDKEPYSIEKLLKGEEK